MRQKGAYPDPPPVVPHPESLAAQAAYTDSEALFTVPGSAMLRCASRLCMHRPVMAHASAEMEHPIAVGTAQATSALQTQGP